MRACFLLLAASVPPAVFPQTSPSLPGCEPRAEVRKALEEKLGWKELQKLKFSEQMERRRAVLGELIAEHPREVEPHRRLLQWTRWWDPDRLPALQERYRKQAADNPGDPLALYLAGVALYRTDTPESSRLLETAKTKAPDFGWPALELAGIYFQGKFTDKKKASENVAAFFAACPGSTDRTAHWFLGKTADTELQTRVVAAVRERFEKATDPKRLKEYETLWGLEFRTRPPQQHDALRKQVLADLKRLESLNPQPDSEWAAFLITGYKQAGASRETLTAREDRLMRDFPKSEEAFRIVQDRWHKEHKEPEDHKDAAAWARHNQIYRDALKGWIRDFPDNRYLQGRARFYAIRDDDSVSEKDGIAEMECYLKASTVDEQPSPWNYTDAAGFLVKHKWQPQRALELLGNARELFEKESERQRQNDVVSAEELENIEKGEGFERQHVDGLTLKAARLAGGREAVRTLAASIEGPPPKDKKRESGYWLNRARLAALEARQADALAYYQWALHTRLESPQYRRGKLEDDLTEEARALWKQMGGSETAWNLWSKPPAPKVQELAEGRWEKPKKQLPAFELPDLTGQTWGLKNLEGKSVLINLWATWCGPCQAELPKLQKLYEKVKGRADTQILTFNIDEDLGLVAPHVKEKGFTFPVLPAYSFVISLLDSIGIPQNWVVDPRGTWRWTQLGYDSAEPNWVEAMIERLESVRGSD